MNRTFVVDDSGDSATVASSTSTFDTITIVPSAEDTGSDTVAWDGDASTPEPDARSCLAPPRNNSLDHLSKSPRASSHTPRTASRTHELRVISRAIRQVGRELASQGVTNPRLAQLVQAMHMRWSPASSKARRLPRRLRKQHGLAPGPKHVMAMQRASDSATDIDPDEDGEWEEAMCEL
uniref:Cell cycle regulatory protein n=1 Tax=Ganoderma boninense TaxID=34458 RepID=A0A5K1K491_9APHY|nr:Cell cycle regulatory protein [Ganoderma boninense]